MLFTSQMVSSHCNEGWYSGKWEKSRNFPAPKRVRNPRMKVFLHAILSYSPEGLLIGRAISDQKPQLSFTQVHCVLTHGLLYPNHVQRRKRKFSVVLVDPFDQCTWNRSVVSHTLVPTTNEQRFVFRFSVRT